MTTPRGIRNRNPLNIRYSAANKWQGLDDPPSDGAFCRFKDDQWGIRAAAVLLQNYQKKYHLRTIEELITRWAPHNENDTRAYTLAVANYMDVSKDFAVDLNDPQEMEQLLRGMCQVECGRNGPYDGEWYTDMVWRQGVKLAMKPLTRSRTMIGGTIAGGATAAQGVLDATLDVLPQAADAAQTVEYVWPEIAKFVLIGVAAIGIGMALFARLDERRQGIT